MRLNLRYVIPVMCGTCIALTVSVAAAVGGVSDNEEELSRLAAEPVTESHAFHAYDFTAPMAYSAVNAVGIGEETTEGGGEETAESGESREITAEPVTAEESGEIGAELSEETSESAEILTETDEPSVEALPEEDEQSFETQADEQPVEAPAEADRQSAEALPEEQPEAPIETEPPAEALPEANEQPEAPAETSAGYDEPQRQAMLEAVNAVRAEYGLSALREMPEISDIAQQRARECASYFSHTRPNGTRWYTLLEEAGLKRNVRAENIAYYYPTAQQALNSWLNDYSHRANILNAEAAYIGIGYYHDGYNAYWVQIFLGA